MSLTWFPDIIGPTSIAANSGAAVGIRKKVLNVISTGITADDEPAKNRTNLRLPDASWNVSTATIGASGEWLPADSTFVAADMVRVSSSTTGTQLTGLDTGATDPTRLVKVIANFGSNSISIQPPASHITGKQYYSGTAYALDAGHAVRMTWDSVARVYRIVGTTVSSYIVLDGTRVALDGNEIHNPD